MDSLTSASQWIFPMECPGCKASSAYPYEAATIRGNTTKIRVALRCRACRREWTLDWESEPAPFDPDPAT